MQCLGAKGRCGDDVGAWNAQGKANFFERRVGEYQRAGVMAGHNDSQDAHHPSDYIFRTDCDF